MDVVFQELQRQVHSDPSNTSAALALASYCRRIGWTYKGKTIDSWVQTLNERDLANKAEVIRILGFIGPAASPAAEALVAILKTPEQAALKRHQLKQHVHSTLLKMGPSVFPQLTLHFREADPELRRFLLHVLVDMLCTETLALDKSDIENLEEGLHDLSPQVRRKTAELLAMLGPAASMALPALAWSLRDSDKDVRILATHAIRRIGAAEPTVPFLIHGLRDREWLVRYGCVRILKDMRAGAEQALPELFHCLLDDSNKVREAASLAIKHIRGEASDQDSELSPRKRWAMLKSLRAPS